MAERALARIAHRTSTRLRIRVPERRHDVAWWQGLGERVRGRPGVVAVEVNPATAGILIVHDGSFDPTQAELIELELQLTNGEQRRAGGTLLDRTAAAINAIDTRIKLATAGTLDLASISLVGLAGMMLVQVARGHLGRPPPAITVAWYAAELMRTRAARGP